ncbi:MAG: hypothetical protein OQK09_09860 [Colwellia sp.]|nr:hypothetical protein [Colwellia sp.]MCW9081802.1 hypothetical protein [Colwellia sp.]
MNKTIISLILIVSFITVAHGQSFHGQALHKNEHEARQHAIADLQQNLYVNVESLTQTQQSNNNEDVFRFTSKLSSTLPILGAQTECFSAYKVTQCDASIDSKKSAPMYQAAILQKQKIIDSQWQKTKNITAAQIKYQALAKLLTLIQETQQLTLVLSIIEPSSNISPPAINATDINQAMLSLEQVANGLPMAALLLTKRLITDKTLNKAKVLVKPFTPYESPEITPFASALQTQLSSQINAVLASKDAAYILQGKYQATREYINLEAQLVDNQGNIITAAVMSINKASVAQFDHQPKQLDFERLLYSGQIVGSSFTAKLTTNKGQRDLLFRPQETIQLLVKVNKPSYFYIVGHANNNERKLSYLLDLNNAPGDDKFISYLGIDEVNKWVVIGEFEAQAPFGSESLQLFSATIKPIEMLPATTFDGTYHVIAGKRSNAMAKTRGLVKKQKKVAKDGKVQAEVAEAVLSLTTAL